ncbi:MAG: phosphopantetheine-binding protein, partial [Pseudomonadota bacterium]
GNAVPAGVPGEVLIGGRRLAQGYWQRPDLTREKFVTLPLSINTHDRDTPHSEHRFYRSGDMARLDDAGALVYLGRQDDQVKVRGVRIERAEVEAALTNLPGINECYVAVLEPRTPQQLAPVHRCPECGIGSDVPGVSFDRAGLCKVCTDFDAYRSKAQGYFKTTDDLRAQLHEARARTTSRYDCIMLLSGGKDSTYALYQLAALGPRILTLTLDNGYISDEAKQNITRVVTALGVDHRFLSTPAMDAIFVDSLDRFSNVCQGCFKTIYTLALNTALEEGIPLIVTGLSRGQLFETRLTKELFDGPDVDIDAIDATVLEARKTYHRLEDAVSQHLPVAALKLDHTFDRVKIIDFYRYHDVPLSEVYRFLAEHVPWIRPGDTGRSTNCLINDVGIYVHKRREGFHNYALPYSWDVRMGHKTREAALEELDDDIDQARVHQILDAIGYTDPEVTAPTPERALVAYCVGEPRPDVSTLRAALAEQLPDAMIPAYFVGMDALPLTANGKIDKAALPDPRGGRRHLSAAYRAPRTAAEQALARIWCQVLRIDRAGLDDNFYDLGGDSISAIRIAALARDEGLPVTAVSIFEHQTIALLAQIDHPPGDDGSDRASEEVDAFSLIDLSTEDQDALGDLLDGVGSDG